jgi:hypothetical protein
MSEPIWVHWARWILRHELHRFCQAVTLAQANAENAELQLTIVRAMLATTMRERDNYAAALDHIAYELAGMKRRRREEVSAARTWITRSIAPRSGKN